MISFPTIAMRASTAALLLATAVLAAVAAPASALRLGGFNFDVCETYNKTACAEHADKCTMCRAW